MEASVLVIRGWLQDCNQTGAMVRQERTVGDLRLEFRRPTSRNRGYCTMGNILPGKAIVFNEIAVTLDNRLAATMTARIFVTANHSRQVSSVNVTKPGLPSNCNGPQQIFRRGVVGISHFVVFVECGHMPGNVRRDAGKKIGYPRSSSSESLKPGISRVTISSQTPMSYKLRIVSRIGFEAAAKLVIVPLVEAL